MQHIFLFTSHPPKVPFSLVPYTFSFNQVLHASQLSPVPNNEGRGESLSHKLLSFQGSPNKAPGQDLAQKGCFPRIPEGIFNCRATSHQNPKIWHQKAPGQDLAQKGRFPRIPEGRFNCRATSRQNPKIWRQKAPGQDLAQKGRFPRIPEGSFNCRARSHQSLKSWVLTRNPWKRQVLDPKTFQKDGSSSQNQGF